MYVCRYVYGVACTRWQSDQQYNLQENEMQPKKTTARLSTSNTIVRGAYTYICMYVSVFAHKHINNNEIYLILIYNLCSFLLHNSSCCVVWCKWLQRGCCTHITSNLQQHTNTHANSIFYTRNFLIVVQMHRIR